MNLEKLEIFACLGPKECLNNDLVVTDDNDVKWVYRLISTNVEQPITLIVQSVGSLAFILDNRSPTVSTTDIHDGHYRGHIIYTLTCIKITTKYPQYCKKHNKTDSK